MNILIIMIGGIGVIRHITIITIIIVLGIGIIHITRIITIIINQVIIIIMDMQHIIMDVLRARLHLIAQV